MVITRWWVRSTRRGLLHRLSGGRAGRAVLVLVGGHLGVLAVVALFWFVGFAPVFDGWRWAVAVPASAVYVVGVVWLLAAFGFWGVGASSGQDGGDQNADFSPGVAFGLGWLRWALQVATIGGAFVLVVLLWIDMRWWHLFPTPEVEGLPAKAATMPIPDDWQRDDVTVGDRPMGAPQAVYRQHFEAPADYGYSDLEQWFTSPEWDATFGRLQAVECDDDLERCEAELVPVDGEPVEYFVEASWRDPSIDALPTTVDVEVVYRHPDASADPTYALGPSGR